MSMIINPYQFGTPAGGDPYYANVVSLLNMDEPDGTTFTDAKGKIWNPQGNAQIISDWYVGDGTGDALALSASSPDFQYGTGDFTLEGFLETSVKDRVIFDNRATGFTGSVMYTKAGTGFLGFFVNTGAMIEVLGSTDVCDGAIHHFAFSRVSGVMYIGLDGAIDGSGAVANDMNDLGFLFIGASNSISQSWQGRLRGLRVTKGVGRYSASYTPPTWPLPTF